MGKKEYEIDAVTHAIDNTILARQKCSMCTRAILLLDLATQLPRRVVCRSY